MGEAHLEELAIELMDLLVDPGVGAAGPWCGAALNDPFEVAVAADLEGDCWRMVLRRLREIWMRSSGRMPRISGSIQ